MTGHGRKGGGMKAETIARALGGAYRAGDWWRSRCPVHNSSGASLALTDGGNGLVVHCHAGCSRAAIMVELKRLGLADTADEPADELSRRRDNRQRDDAERRRRIADALDIWETSEPSASGGLISRYLHSRGIALAIPDSIRLHGMHGPYGRHPSGGRRPQMVALVEHVDHGPVGVTRTFLAVDGSTKASLEPVRLFKGVIRAGAVRLAQVVPGEWLVIGEGIETVLSVMQACSLPGWAALSAGGLEAVAMPPDARKILVAGDNDANGRGQRAAIIAGKRFQREGREVKVIIPPNPDTDWNDVLLGRAPGVRRHG